MKKCAVLVFLLVGCSSLVKEEEHGKRQRDYKVVDYSHQRRPAWIWDISGWSKKYNHDTDKFRYFAHETDPKVDRELACHLATANARASAAAEVSSFIKEHLGSSAGGDIRIDQNNPQMAKVSSYVERTLEQRVRANLRGVRPMQVYWEKRQYSTKLGAKGDFVAYSCAALVKVERSRLARAMEREGKKMIKRAEGRDAKARVKEVLQKAADHFAKKGVEE